MQIFPESQTSKEQKLKCQLTRLPIGGLQSRTPFVGCEDPDGNIFAMAGKASGRGDWDFFWYIVTFSDRKKNCLRDLDTFLTATRVSESIESLNFDFVRTSSDGKRWYRGHSPFETVNSQTGGKDVRYQIDSATEEGAECKIEACLEGLELFANPLGQNPRCEIPEADEEQRTLNARSHDAATTKKIASSEALETLCDLGAELSRDLREIDQDRAGDCEGSALSPELMQCTQRYENQKLNLIQRYDVRMARFREKAQKQIGRELKHSDCCDAMPSRYRFFGEHCVAYR